MIVSVQKGAADSATIPEGATGELTVVKPHEVSVVDRAANTHKFIFAKSATPDESRGFLISAAKSLNEILNGEGDMAEQGREYTAALAAQFGLQPSGDVAKSDEASGATEEPAAPAPAATEEPAPPELDPFEKAIADMQRDGMTDSAPDGDFEAVAAAAELALTKASLAEAAAERDFAKAELAAKEADHAAALAKAVEDAKAEVAAELAEKTATIEDLTNKLADSEASLHKAQARSRSKNRHILAGLGTQLRLAKASAEAPPKSQAQPTVERPPSQPAFREVLDINDDD